VPGNEKLLAGSGAGDEEQALFSLDILVVLLLIVVGGRDGVCLGDRASRVPLPGVRMPAAPLGPVTVRMVSANTLWVLTSPCPVSGYRPLLRSRCAVASDCRRASRYARCRCGSVSARSSITRRRIAPVAAFSMSVRPRLPKNSLFLQLDALPGRFRTRFQRVAITPR
jgi:hypothetical protein